MSEVPRLFLITPPVADAARFRPLIEAALLEADVACVLLRTAGRDAGEAKALVRDLAPIIQARGAALLIENDARLAARVDADGVHMIGAGPSLGEALTALQPRKIVGVGGLRTRDAAMQAGEAGADYVMFGGPDDASPHQEVLDRVSWWAEIFNVPCVAYARSPDVAIDFVEAGAEFIALCEGLWDEPDAVAATVRQVSRAMASVPEATR